MSRRCIVAIILFDIYVQHSLLHTKNFGFICAAATHAKQGIILISVFIYNIISRFFIF